MSSYSSTSPIRTVLIANPSADVYGSDLQMLQSVRALRSQGWRVVVAIPAGGPLTAQLRAAGAEIDHIWFPVLRRSSASPLGMARLAFDAARAAVVLQRYVRRHRPAVVYVNTVTLPWWLLAARLARTPSLCHVHEAETKDSALIRKGLTAPLGLATVVLANSRTTLSVIAEDAPRAGRKAVVVYNGVPEPDEVPHPPTEQIDPFRLLVVGRLSPRKAPDVALEATALLRNDGFDVRIEICGSPFAGYEWFEDEIRRRAQQPDLEGAVTFSGYVNPTWDALARAHVVIAPSLGESLGNAVIEAQFALRPVVATGLQGHLETVQDGRTGLLVPAQNPAAVAAAVRRLMADRDLAAQLASAARKAALSRFTIARYRSELVSIVERLAGGR